MSRRLKVISATALTLIGATLLIVPLLGGSQLEAAGLSATGVDIGRYLVWGGVIILVASALIFISASAE